MILSEEEARTRWCPQTGSLAAVLMQLAARPGFTPGAIAIQDTRQHPLVKCQASQCAVWRWQKAEADIGYCGLAGPPIYSTDGNMSQASGMALS